MKHWVKGGYYYYHNLETQGGGWDEPADFVQNSVQLSREEIQVGRHSSHVRENAAGLVLVRGQYLSSLGLKCRLCNEYFGEILFLVVCEKLKSKSENI